MGTVPFRGHARLPEGTVPVRGQSLARRLQLMVGLALTLALCPHGAEAKRKARAPDPVFAPTPALTPSTPAAEANGAIFSAQSYSPLTSGNRAAKVGDLVTILLAERTSAAQANDTKTDKNGSFGITPPTTGPLSFFSPEDVNIGGDQSFKGKGEISQTNSLNGEISVTIAEVYPNGTALVRGEKLMAMNRGDERVQISGIIRLADVGADNRVLSTRVADARIFYVGKGDAARASKPGWLAHFFSAVSPF
jgi:flagellar L-ring protein FlgH